MAEAIVKLGEPIVEGVVLTLSEEEAKLLMRFLGKTSIRTVEQLLPDMKEMQQYDVNRVLSNVFDAFANVIDYNYSEF
jgi:hypothetical protein